VSEKLFQRAQTVQTRMGPDLVTLGAGKMRIGVRDQLETAGWLILLLAAITIVITGVM
jgi:hypothetical protein